MIFSDSKFEGFSGDASMLLFAYDIDAVWRHSFTATYLVLDSVNNKVFSTFFPISIRGVDRLGTRAAIVREGVIEGCSTPLIYQSPLTPPTSPN